MVAKARDGAPGAGSGATLRPNQMTALCDWLADRIGGRPGALEAELIAGGRSNLTYRLTADDGRAWVLRRPPPGTLSRTAHDVVREYRIMHALASSAVPVPATIGACEDASVLGVPFIVAEFIDGQVIRSADDAAWLPPDRRRRIGEQAIATLSKIHRVDVDTCGLADLGRRNGYLGRQLRRWRVQHDQVADPDPTIGEAHLRLSRAAPQDSGSVLVHGDFRVDNLIFDDDGVLAVVDWELSTLGDPLADLAMTYVYWAGPGAEVVTASGAPTTADGFLLPDEMLRLYGHIADTKLDGFDFYVAFAYWRLACILEGVLDRYRHGAAAGDRSSVEGYPHFIEWMASLAMERLPST